MTFWESFGLWLAGRASQKNSASRSLIAMNQVGRAVEMEKNYKTLAKEGYQKNVVAYRAVSGIAGACKGIKWCLYEKNSAGEKMEIMEHPLLSLLARPNPIQGQSAFIESVVAYQLLSGNSYIQAITSALSNEPNTSEPLELWPARPDVVKVVPGERGLPVRYEFKASGGTKVFPVDQLNGNCQVLHIKTFNPLDIWYGMSPLQAAALSVDQHNESSRYNLAMLQNMATPSGALIVKPDSDGAFNLTDEQRQALKQELAESYQGSRNAGKPMVLEGGLDWRQMGFNAKDMDWLQGKHSTARDIALAYNYPPMLLGIPGDNTYSNYKEAKLSLYEEAVLPTMDHLRDELNCWLTPRFGDRLYLDYDKDGIDALTPKRDMVWTRVQTSDFLTINEKREAVGYEPVEGGDDLMVEATKVPLGFDFMGGGEPISDDDLMLGDEGEGAKAIDYKATPKDEVRFDDFVRRWVDMNSARKITTIQGVTKRAVIKAVRETSQEFLQDGSNITQLSDAIKEKIESNKGALSNTRAMRIARTETTIAANEGSRGAAKALNVPGLMKEWVSSDDGRTRDQDDSANHRVMNGKQVGLEEKFLVPSKDGPDEMDGPGDPNAPADQVVNCRCVQVYAMSEKQVNLRSQREKLRFWHKINRKRQRHERRMANQLGAAFKMQVDEMLSAIDGIEISGPNDVKLIELALDRAIEQTGGQIKKVFDANYTLILSDFGRDVLSLES